MRVLHTTHRPQAFTLIELLVVLAIIAILAALSFVGYLAIFGRQYERNTTGTIEHLTVIFKKQWNQVCTDARNEEIPDAIKILAAPDSSNERARVLLTKFRLAEAFPGTFTDIKDYTNPKSSRYLYAYLAKPKYLLNYSSQWVAKVKSKTAYDLGLVQRDLQLQLQRESSACLFMALSTAKGNVAVNVDQLPTKPVDTDFTGDGVPDLPVFGDAWGNPIAFFRFPTCPTGLGVNNPFTVKRPSMWTYVDPIDPKMALASTNWPAANRAVYQNIMGYDVGANFTIPVLASAGRDGILDLRFADPSPSLAPSWDTNLIPPAVWLYNDMALLSHELSPNVDPYNCTKDNLYSFDFMTGEDLRKK